MNAADFFLKVGDRIIAEVEEEISATEFIVGYRGQLLRVKNTTGVPFLKGDLLRLTVVQQEPMELQLFKPHSNQFERFG